MERMSTVYLILVRGDLLRDVYDVKIVRGMCRKMSNHKVVVLCKLKIVYGC